jgi:hypothetical protein
VSSGSRPRRSTRSGPAGRPALRTGGLRWLHVTSDTMVYLREFEQNSLLVAARRASGEAVRLALGAARPVSSTRRIWSRTARAG